MIDAHQHFWRYTSASHGWIDDSMQRLRRDFLPVDLEPLLRAAGQSGCIAVQAAASLDETRWLLELAQHNPWIRGVVGWAELRSPVLEETLVELSRNPRLVGLRHLAQDEPDARFLLDPQVLRGLALLERHGLAFDILLRAHQLESAIELVRALPGQRFVLDHLGKPLIAKRVLQPWAGQLRELARSPNVCAKISGLVTEADPAHWTPADLAPYLTIALEAFGPQRLLLGSDWPVCLLAGNYEQVLAAQRAWLAPLAPLERAAIEGGNAERWYRLIA